MSEIRFLCCSENMDTDVPSPKRAKMDNGDAYIPTKEHSDGEPTFSVIFSLREEKGALARALKPFEVSQRDREKFNRECLVEVVPGAHGRLICSWSYILIVVEVVNKVRKNSIEAGELCEAFCGKAWPYRLELVLHMMQAWEYFMLLSTFFNWHNIYALLLCLYVVGQIPNAIIRRTPQFRVYSTSHVSIH